MQSPGKTTSLAAQKEYCHPYCLKIFMTDIIEDNISKACSCLLCNWTDRHPSPKADLALPVSTLQILVCCLPWTHSARWLLLKSTRQFYTCMFTEPAGVAVLLSWEVGEFQHRLQWQQAWICILIVLYDPFWPIFNRSRLKGRWLPGRYEVFSPKEIQG